MGEPWFSDLVRGLSDRADNGAEEAPAELELETEQCVVRAAPVKAGQALGVTVCFRAADTESLFDDSDVLRMMIRLHQGVSEAGEWRFGLTEENRPFFATYAPQSDLTTESFNRLLEDAVEHAQLAASLAELVSEQGVDALDPAALLMMIRG